ncbi:MAG: hypothetical protein ACFB9M_09455 [Myxococcota bacterium]
MARYVLHLLPEPHRWVLNRHIDQCRFCQRIFHVMAESAAELVFRGSEVPISAEGKARIMKSIEDSAMAPIEAEDAIVEPTPSIEHEAWRWLVPGVRRAVIPTSGPGRLWLYELEPNRGLPHHGHDGLELTLILDGKLRVNDRVHIDNDLMVATADDTHQPRVEGSEPCRCLLALEGRVRLTSVFERILQRLLRI